MATGIAGLLGQVRVVSGSVGRTPSCPASNPRVIFDAEFVSENGLGSAEANVHLRRDTDAKINSLGELDSVLSL